MGKKVTLTRAAAEGFFLPMKRALHGLVLPILTRKEKRKYRNMLPDLEEVVLVTKEDLIIALRNAGFPSYAKRCEELKTIVVPFRRAVCQ